MRKEKKNHEIHPVVQFSRRAEKDVVAITQDELIEALKKRERLDLSGPVTVVFSFRSMNGSERWQVVELTRGGILPPVVL